MSPILRSAAVFAAAFVTLALSGCGPEAEGTGTIRTADAIDSSMTAAATEAPGDAASGDSASGDSASGGTCPTVPQEGYELFSSDQVVTPPIDGAIYGDGTQISWIFAGPVDGTPDVDISYVNTDGDAMVKGGIFLDDLGNNEWGKSLNIFDSDADGRPAFMILGLTHDVGVAADGTLAGDHEIVGVYCVTLKVAP